MAPANTTRIGLLTSGGDAQGMNAAVRSVVRSALNREVEVYGIFEGYTGMVEGGERISKLSWESVGGILQQGGTILGSSRCDAFRTRKGRRQAALNLIKLGIDHLIIIGGDGSLTGANIFRKEWPSLVEDLVKKGLIDKKTADKHPALLIAGLVGSIDNDMHGTDMTIGADSALHRITEAIDAIASTAASHQRTFVVEVMGRNCGYLALMSALATGASWVLIPEHPPTADNWEERMCDILKAKRDAGRRDTIVVVSEGAIDKHGNPIKSEYVKQVLEEQLGEATRLTILGHVQRGGSPSAFDRNLGTLLGYAAVELILDADYGDDPQLIGIRGNRVTSSPLMENIDKTHTVADTIKRGSYEEAMTLRGGSFSEAFRTYRTTVRTIPHPPTPEQRRLRLAILHSGSPAPGMNTATRAAARLGIDQGHIMLGIRNGFRGLVKGYIEELGWMSVQGWASRGGAELGTNRYVPSGRDFYDIARNIEDLRLDGLLIIGGWTAYEGAYALLENRKNYPSFEIPIVCLPATINNNLPGSELSIGADTALNNIVDAVDKIKQSAVAQNRCFVVEVMGRDCGYLALMSGMATGAERVYLNEDGITLRDLQSDVKNLIKGFKQGKRLGLMIRNENANPIYTSDFISALFEEEGGDLFDVRKAILGHLQQGGNPSPFDRIQATRFATRGIEYLIELTVIESMQCSFIDLATKELKFHILDDFPRLIDESHFRPKDQWWMDLQKIAKIMAQPGPIDITAQK
jgi:6-phosphofructokinase 1